jgi:hypothetical protein
MTMAVLVEFFAAPARLSRSYSSFVGFRKDRSGELGDGRHA